MTSLGGHPLEIDAAGIDVAFRGTQKMLNCPPGLAPFTVGERALAKLRAARTARPLVVLRPVARSSNYWHPDRAGAPPGPTTTPRRSTWSTRCAKRSALVVGDGWPAADLGTTPRAHHALRDALGVLGCVRLAPRTVSSCTRCSPSRPPDGVDEAAIRTALLLDHGIEISGGLGPLAGRLWRIGVMGAGANPEPQQRLVLALAELIGADPAEPLAALEEGWREL